MAGAGFLGWAVSEAPPRFRQLTPSDLPPLTRRQASSLAEGATVALAPLRIDLAADALRARKKKARLSSCTHLFPIPYSFFLRAAAAALLPQRRSLGYGGAGAQRSTQTKAEP